MFKSNKHVNWWDGINFMQLLCLTDKNECVDPDCVENAVCENTVGSFKCKCGPGFTGDPNVECTGKYYSYLC